MLACLFLCTLVLTLTNFCEVRCILTLNFGKLLTNCDIAYVQLILSNGQMTVRKDRWGNRRFEQWVASRVGVWLLPGGTHSILVSYEVTADIQHSFREKAR
ncbi:hypothetical protein J2T15_003723 [Paenibacillus harenae]|uniref:Secreted protein n=1 Tax=Paenibacillus harenae TaxID=306543 RepID=A0ABT9U3Q4_PAEHA|nr:hypothetical protein [Paenibacillus harenae]